MTQDSFAEQAGVTPRYIMAIENENKYPRMPVLLKIIRALKISADTIFYPEIQHSDREKEQFMHIIQLCGKKEIKIAAATVFILRFLPLFYVPAASCRTYALHPRSL